MSEYHPDGDPTQRTLDTVQREVATVEAKIQILLSGLEQMTEEKFSSVYKQFELVERQRAEQKVDTKQAVDAALTAQKEAVKEQTTASERAIAKSEMATTKQLDQLGVTFSTAIAGVTTLLNDLKERVTKVEATKAGGDGAINSRRADSSLIVASAGVLISLAMAIFVMIRG